MKKLFLLAFLASPAALAKTEVVLFGGYLASRAQMDCWVKGANENTAKNRGFKYRGIPWPSGAPAAPASAIVRVARAKIDELVKEIDRNPDTRYIVAGHSSGSAMADQVARQVARPQQVVLVNLDGFTTAAALQSRATCWYAERKDENGRTLASSRNARSMKNCAKNKAYANRTCVPGASMCLHFTLVNTKAPANLGGDFASRGYAGCGTNLDWVTPE